MTAGGSHGEDTGPTSAWSIRYSDLTYQEIRERAKHGAIAIVPTGCTEQQGPHLPVGFDTWFAEQLMQTAADRARTEHGVSALVLPALPFGPTSEHRNFGAGYIDIPREVHQQMIWAILSSLVDQGFQRILVWRGCGGHALSDLIQRFNTLGRVQVYLPDQPFHAIWRRFGDMAVPGGHADSFATSICLHLRPDGVRVDRIMNPENQSINWDNPNLDFSRYSATGVIGDPTHASADLGRQLWHASVQAAMSDLVAAANSS